MVAIAATAPARFDIATSRMNSYLRCTAQRGGTGTALKRGPWRTDMTIFESATSLVLAVAAQALAVGVVVLAF